MANEVRVRITGKNDSADAFKEVEHSLERLKEGLEAIGFGLSIRELAEGVKSTAEHFDSLAKSAEKTGIGIEKLQELQYAAKMADLPAEALDTAMARLAKSAVQAANGQGSAAQAFKLLGVSVTDAGGKMRPLDDIVEQVGQKFASLKNGTDKLNAAVELFGRGGAQLVPFLNHLSEFSDEAERLHLVVGKDLVEAGATFNDNLKIIDTTLTGLKNRVVSEVLPSFVRYSQELVEVSANSDSRKFSGIAQALVTVVATIDACVTGLQQMWLRLEDIAELAQVISSTSTNPGGLGAGVANYLANHKQRNSQYDQLNNHFWDRMGSLYNPQPLQLPEVKGAEGGVGGDFGAMGRSTAASSTAALDAAASRIRAVLAELAGANGDAAEKVRLEWSNKAEDIRRLFEKFPQLIKEFGRVDLLADLTGRMAALKEQTKQQAEALEEANKAFSELAKADQKLPNLGGASATLPTLRIDMLGASLDRFYADRQEQARLSEQVMQDSLTATQRYTIELAKLDTLLKSGAISQDAYNKSQAKLRSTMDESTIAWKQFGVEVANSAQLSALFSGGWTNAFKSVEIAAIQLIAKLTILKQLQSWSDSKGGGGIAGFVNTLAGGILGGGGLHDFAGPAYGGVSYKIGTQEYFTPATDGYITPVRDLRSGGAPSVQLNVINQGTPVSARTGPQRWDATAKRFVIDVVLDNVATGGELRDLLARR